MQQNSGPRAIAQHFPNSVAPAPSVENSMNERKRNCHHLMDNVLNNVTNTVPLTKMSPELKKSKTLSKENCLQEAGGDKSPVKKTLSKDVYETLIDDDFSSEDFFNAFGDAFPESDKIVPYSFDLSEQQHCIIKKITKSNFKTILELKSTKSEEELAICNVEGFWQNNKLSIGDNLYIQASKVAGANEWVINNETGWLVYEPDLLISCTTVVGSMFCKRKCVLKERYKGFDSSNRAMIIGVLVHNLLQNVLRLKLQTAIQIESQMEQLCQSHDFIKRLYECGLGIDEIKGEVAQFIPKIIDFINEYVLARQFGKAHGNWVGKIESIDDIEENIWCPELGIKGKIDVSVTTPNGPMPVELKTGRATVSMEHRGQVILYIMMMNKLKLKVSSGLLLYLKEGVLKEIPMNDREKRDLVILRNELAYYLTRKTEKFGQVFKLPELPEPLNHHSACKTCEYSGICTALLRNENFDLSSNKILNKLKTELTSHLSEDHLNYFFKWSSLITLESEVTTGQKSMRDIYTMDPKKREKQGKCIISLEVKEVAPESNGLYVHTLEKTEYELTQSKINFYASGISEGNYVIVSTDTRPAIASGFVLELTSTTITVTLDRNLRSKYSGSVFHIDIFDSAVSHSFNLSSLSLLLDSTPRASKLRSLIIDRKPPTFLKKLSSKVAKEGVAILKQLNRVQQRAVLKALSAEDYLLIEGMPGTGKTATIVALIQLLVKLGKSVLLTSHTHLAVDNVCVRLKKLGVDFIRLGSTTRIDSTLEQNSEYAITKNCKTPQEFEAAYNKFNVIAVTCLGSGHPLLSKRTMDVCIVDESTQVLQTSLFRPLFAANSFILIGDPNQLPPIIRNRDALNAGMAESLFVLLQNPEATITLNLNYRMNKVITNVANCVTYEGKLLIGNENVANGSLNLPNIEAVRRTCEKDWVLKALDTSLDCSVQIIDTGPVWKTPEDFTKLLQSFDYSSEIIKQSNHCNPQEASIVSSLVATLLEGGVPEIEIGVIATFKAQVALISTLLKDTNVVVSTVDQFQGQDKSVIIYSCTKSKDEKKMSDDLQNELLEDKRRLTVAITRAKHKFILIGDLNTIRRYSSFKTLLNTVNSKRILKVEGNLL